MKVHLTIFGSAKLFISITKLEQIYRELGKVMGFSAGSICKDEISLSEKYRIDVHGDTNQNEIIGLILYLNSMSTKTVERTEVRLSIDGGQDFVQVYHNDII